MGDRVAVMRKGELQQVAEPAGALRPAGQPLRRRLHRLAGDEHARGDARAAERRPRREVGSQTVALDEETARGPPGARRSTWAARVIARHPARGPRGRRARDGHAGRPAAEGRGRAARGARLGDHGALRGRRAAGADGGREGARAGRRRATVPSSRRTRAPDTTSRRPLRRALAREGGRDRPRSRSTRASLHFFDPETGSGSTTTTHERSHMNRNRFGIAVAPRRSRSPLLAAGCGGGGGESSQLDGGGAGAASANVSGKHHDHRRLDRRRAEVLPGGPRRVQREVPERQGQVQPDRRQHADRALDRGAGRQPARPRVGRRSRA